MSTILSRTICHHSTRAFRKIPSDLNIDQIDRCDRNDCVSLASIPVNVESDLLLKSRSNRLEQTSPPQPPPPPQPSPSSSPNRQSSRLFPVAIDTVDSNESIAYLRKSKQNRNNFDDVSIDDPTNLGNKMNFLLHSMEPIHSQ